jgi:hypothetical protein
MHLYDTPSLEDWRPLASHAGWYSVSNFGRVRRDKPGSRTHPGRILRLTTTASGYLSVRLAQGHARGRRTRLVHHLVAEAFIGARGANQVINHRNGVKTDNRPENLEWITQEQNVTHATINGFMPAGERNGHARLTEAAVQDIRTSPLTAEALALKYGVSKSLVFKVRARIRWSHLS